MIQKVLRAIGTIVFALPFHLEAEEEKKGHQAARSAKLAHCERLHKEMHAIEIRLKNRAVYQFLATKFRASNRNPENEQRDLRILKSRLSIECQ